MPEQNATDKVTRGQGDKVTNEFTLSPLHLVTLSFILLAYLAIGIQYAALTPAWQAPDEPAHYNVIRQIAQSGQLPRLQPGDYDQAYLTALVSNKFPSDQSIDSIQYQDYQPPLYYLLLTPVFLFFGGALLPLRLASLLFGAGAIIFAYLAARSISNLHSSIPLLTAGFIAFIPQYLAVTASVNNDSLSLFLIALGLWLTLRINRELEIGELVIGHWSLGVVLGLAFLTKVWAYVLAPTIVMMLLMHWQRAKRFPSRAALIIFVPALLMGALYWGRNWFVCGPMDFLCGVHHNTIVVGQPTTAQWIAAHGWWGSGDALLNRFFTFTFASFWGVFGWMGVFMDARVYQLLALYSIALVIGAVSRQRSAVSGQPSAFCLLSSVFLFTLALYLYYNLSFVQHQGRYLFPALIPIGLTAAAGLRQWARWLAGRWPRVETALSFLPLAGMAVLSELALYRFILPALR